MNKLLLVTLAFVFCAIGNAPAQLSATVNQTNPTCNASNGSASVSASGGSNYTYKWNTGSTNDNISNVPAGTYTVTVYASGTNNYLEDTIYKETFDEANPKWTLNIPTGSNDAQNNYWALNDSAGGAPDGQCVQFLGGDKTLFITSFSGNTTLTPTEKEILSLGASPGADPYPTPGATWDNGSTCGYTSYFGFGWCTGTNMAAQSAAISTTDSAHLSGSHNLVVSYDFIGGGAAGSDYGSSLYSINGGTNFTTLDPSLMSSQLCNFTIPGAGSIDGGQGGGIWARRSYNLPAGAYGIANFILRFNWTDAGDGNGNDPSVAINNILILDSIPTGAGGLDSIVKTVTLSNGSVSPPTVTATKLLMCSNDTSVVCASAGFKHYAWNDMVDTTQCINATAAGPYYVTATDNNGCTVESNTANISVYPVPSVSIVQTGDTLASYGQSGYQWYFGSQQINGATLPVYIATQSGQYEVLITDTNGCTALSSPVTVKLTGVQDLTKNVGFEIFPNPASTGSIQLTINTECVGCEIQVIDALGRVVYQSEVNGSTQFIDISKLAKGTYLIKIAGGVKEFIRD